MENTPTPEGPKKLTSSSMDEKATKEVLDALKKNNFNNSIIFCVHSPEPEKMEMIEVEGKKAASFLAAGHTLLSGDPYILHQVITTIMASEDRIYDFFSTAVDEARKIRNKKDPNVN